MNQLSFIAMMDNGGRRLKVERRKKNLPINVPDRRSGKDRRTGLERRGSQKISIRKTKERRGYYLEPNI